MSSHEQSNGGYIRGPQHRNARSIGTPFIWGGLMVLVHHHVKYKEIHGVDEVVLMEKSEHAKLHRRLRKEGRCSVDPKILRRVSHNAHERLNLRRRYKTEWDKDKYLSDEGFRTRDNARGRFYKMCHRHNSIVPRLRPDIISSAMTSN